MNRLLLILTFFLTLVACSNNTDIQGYWRLSFDEEIENDFLPYELSFKRDTVWMVDSYNFKQKSGYSVIGDSISITFENGLKKNYSFSVLNDSAITFADKVYFRTSEALFSKTQSYKLLGWKSNQEFNPEVNSIIIHLIKAGDSTKVILNDATTDLFYLPEFLRWEPVQKPKIYLYLGEGIKLIDLLDAYCWIKYSGYRKVELITSNLSFEKFYSIQDHVDIADEVFLKFREENLLPPLPTQSELNNSLKDVFINSEGDFTFSELSDTTSYRYNFSCRLDIKKYLELTEKLNNSESKIIKRLTTL